MNKEDIIRMAREVGGADISINGWTSWVGTQSTEFIERFAALVASVERKTCEALHDHEDVQAPVGNSSWGEAYQEGWGQGTAAYRDAIRARGQA